jgi:superfamily II DNA/RNA helicase
MLKKETEGLVADEIRSFVEDELEAQSNLEIKRNEEGNLIITLPIDEKIKKGLEGDLGFLDEIIKGIEKIDEFVKVKRVVELIREIKPSTDKKIVVFVGFIKTGERLVEILKNEGIKSEFFYGDLEEAQREKLIKKTLVQR